MGMNAEAEKRDAATRGLILRQGLDIKALLRGESKDAGAAKRYA